MIPLSAVDPLEPPPPPVPGPHFENNMIRFIPPGATDLTFPMGLCFNDLADAPGPHCILGRQCEFVPGAALQVLQAVRTFAGADGKTAPLLAVVL